VRNSRFNNPSFCLNVFETASTFFKSVTSAFRNSTLPFGLDDFRSVMILLAFSSLRPTKYT